MEILVTVGPVGMTTISFKKNVLNFEAQQKMKTLYCSSVLSNINTEETVKLGLQLY